VPQINLESAETLGQVGSAGSAIVAVAAGSSAAVQILLAGSLS
jgi:hypothetical protein